MKLEQGIIMWLVMLYDDLYIQILINISTSKTFSWRFIPTRKPNSEREERVDHKISLLIPVANKIIRSRLLTFDQKKKIRSRQEHEWNKYLESFDKLVSLPKLDKINLQIFFHYSKNRNKVFHWKRHYNIQLMKKHHWKKRI